MRGKLTYSNVVSTLCLFIVLGGSAYAASRLPANSVGSKQLRANSVNTRKVRDASLRASDFAAGQLPVGAQGATGPTGVTGADGTSGPGAGFGAYRDSAVPVGTSLTSIATLTGITPGKYMIVAKTVLSETDIYGDPATCSLLAPPTGGPGGDSDTVSITMGNGGSAPNPGDSRDEALSLEVLHNFISTGTARVQCSHTYSAVVGMTASNTKIVAIPLSTFTNTAVTG